jgi:hypothetical protein
MFRKIVWSHYNWYTGFSLVVAITNRFLHSSQSGDGRTLQQRQEGVFLFLEYFLQLQRASDEAVAIPLGLYTLLLLLILKFYYLGNITLINLAMDGTCPSQVSGFGLNSSATTRKQ